MRDEDRQPYGFWGTGTSVASVRPVLLLLALAVAGAFSFAGCSAAMLGGANRAPKCLPLPLSSSRAKVWVGEQQGAYNQTNRMRAQAEAMQTGLSELGVTVSAESLMSAISDVRIDEDGRREIYREKSERNVVIKVADTEVRGAKVAYCTNSRNALEARVSLGIGEWHRIRRSKLGTTVIMLECRSPVPRVCKGAKLHALLRKAVVEAGLKPLSVLEPEEAMSPNSPKMVKRLGVHNDAGYILWVILEGQSKCGPGECKQLRQFVSVTTASLTLLDTGDGKTIHSWSSPDDCSYKVNLPSRMHYTLSDTLRKSMHGSVSGTDTCGAGVQQGLATWDKSAE